MITVEALVYEFKLAMNRINRQDNVDIPIEDVIVYLNNAQLSWIKTKINPNNPLRQGLDSIRKRIDDLQEIKVSGVVLKPTKTKDNFLLGYECSLSGVENYMFYGYSNCLASRKKCKAYLKIDLVKQGEIQSKYTNTDFTPSFEWRTTLSTLGDNKLFVYKAADFNIEEVYLTYLRYPVKIDIEGYETLEGKPSQTSHCELPEYAKSDIVDLAVKFAAHANENQLIAGLAEDRLVKHSE